jgi:dihydroorotase
MSAYFVRHGRVIDPLSGVDQVLDLRISSGKVLETGTALTARSERVIEARDLWVVPGLVDLRATLRDQDDVEAALAGGFTAVLLTPESPNVATDRLQVRHARALTRELKGEELGEVPDGTAVLSNGFSPIVRGGVLRRALQYATPLGVLVMVHPEDPSISARGLLGEGPTATRLGLLGVPVAAETSIVARDLEVLRSTGGRLHFSHLTCARSVDLVRDAKRQGLGVTCDVTAHHLTLNDTTADDFSLLARVWPPLRSASDVAGLREGVLDGTVDAIASDHQRVEALDLEHAFEQSSPGIDAFRTFVSRVLGLGLPARTVVEAISTRPAKLAGLGERRLARDSRADLTLIDPHTMSVHATIAGGELRFFQGSTLP